MIDLTPKLRLELVYQKTLSAPSLVGYQALLKQKMYMYNEKLLHVILYSSTHFAIFTSSPVKCAKSASSVILTYPYCTRALAIALIKVFLSLLLHRVRPNIFFSFSNSFAHCIFSIEGFSSTVMTMQLHDTCDSSAGKEKREYTCSILVDKY